MMAFNASKEVTSIASAMLVITARLSKQGIQGSTKTCTTILATNNYKALAHLLCICLNRILGKGVAMTPAMLWVVVLFFVC